MCMIIIKAFFNTITFRWVSLTQDDDIQHYVVCGGQGITDTKDGILPGWYELKLIP